MLLPKYKPSSLLFTLKICLHHSSVTSFLSGATPPKKNTGSTPAASLSRCVGAPGWVAWIRIPASGYHLGTDRPIVD